MDSLNTNNAYNSADGYNEQFPLNDDPVPFLEAAAGVARRPMAQGGNGGDGDSSSSENETSNHGATNMLKSIEFHFYKDFREPNPPELEPTPLAPEEIQLLAPLPYAAAGQNRANDSENETGPNFNISFGQGNIEVANEAGTIDDNNMSILLQGLFTNGDSISELTFDGDAEANMGFSELEIVSDNRIFERDTNTWEKRFNEMAEFKNSRGHCNVSEQNHADLGLVEWVKNQRFYHKLLESNKPSPMTEEQARRLDEIRFEWNAQTAAWDERFEELVEYKHQNGHCNVPRTYRQNQQLSTWVKRQRRQYRASSIIQERIDRLESIGFVWDIVQHREQRKQHVIGAFKAARQNSLGSNGSP